MRFGALLIICYATFALTFGYWEHQQEARICALLWFRNQIDTAQTQISHRRDLDEGFWEAALLGYAAGISAANAWHHNWDSLRSK